MTCTIRRFAAVSLLLLSYSTLARAQSGSLYFAGGSATDSSIGPVDTLGGGVSYPSSSLGGFFETIGADVIFFDNHRLGVGGEISFRKDRGPYAGLEYRPTFYDINAVYQPLTVVRRFTPEVQGGFGRADLKFYYTPQFCLTFPQGCRLTTAQATSTNYLQLHFAGGLRYYVYKDLFVSPKLDVRWVHNLAYFSSSWVPEYSVALGYTFRRGH